MSRLDNYDEVIYLVCCETVDEYGDVLESYDCLETDNYDDAVRFAEQREIDYPCGEDEQLTILAVGVNDREYDYSNAELLWCSK